MSLLDIGPVIFGTTEGLIEYLKTHHLLADHSNCSRCGVAMRQRPRNDVSDCFSWWCPECKPRKTLRHDSFFKKSMMPLQKWLLLMHLWARNYPLSDAAAEAQIDPGTAVDVFQWFRDVCTTHLLQTPIVLGGQGIVVEIDESLFSHKPKYNRGRRTRQEQWAFGMVDTSHDPALGYMEIVHHRDAATLLPIIQAHTAPGTVIHSDEWAAYRQVSTLPNVAAHNIVKHSQPQS